jgi:hypothetical protein
MATDRIVLWMSVFVAVVTTAVSLYVLGRTWLAGWRRRRWLRLGKLAEPQARALLIRSGFEVEATQAPKRVFVTCGGETRVFDVFADFLVRKAGKRFVADSKTGECATVADRSTRRQLLEYFVVFEVDGVLLVDPRRGTIEEVEFPFLKGRRIETPPGPQT